MVSNQTWLNEDMCLLLCLIFRKKCFIYNCTAPNWNRYFEGGYWRSSIQPRCSVGFDDRFSANDVVLYLNGSHFQYVEEVNLTKLNQLLQMINELEYSEYGGKEHEKDWVPGGAFEIIEC